MVVGQKQKTEKKEREKDTPGTAGGPGGRDNGQVNAWTKKPKLF